MKRINLVFLLAVFLFFGSRRIAAVNMSSENYFIQWGNFNTGSGNQSKEDSYKLGITTGQIAPGRYSVDGYIVRSGFQYIHSIIPFRFTISDLTIDFGSLTPGTPALANNRLTVSAGNAGGYQVLTYEDHPLRLMDESSCANNSCINDTTCDDTTCDETAARPWTLDNVYGFGFNMSEDDIPADFVDATYFRQFADDENTETHQIIMSSNDATASAQANVNYKVNISNQQKAGDYETSIVFIAVPTY